MRGIQENIFNSLWAQCESHLMVTTFRVRLLIQQATLPLSHFLSSLSYSFIHYRSTKILLTLFPHPQNQCTIVNKNLGKTPSQERGSPKSSFLVLIIPNYERLMWPHKWCLSVTLLSAPTVVTCPHHFLLRLWSSNDIFDLHLFNFKHVYAPKSMCMGHC